VRPRYATTRHCAWPTGREKKTESASEIARSESPAALVRWQSAYRSIAFSACHILRIGWVAPEAAATVA
jgi:hypothetical protein